MNAPAARRAPTRVLFVDAGNYCRSPAAEVVARTLIQRTHQGLQIAVGSAGLKDKHAGGTADPRTIEVCLARGFDLSAFRCRQITPADFASHDLILAMDRENLEQLRMLRPTGSGASIELFLGDAELPDPYFGGIDGFLVMLDQIEAGAMRLLQRLTDAGGRSDPDTPA